MIDFLNVSFDSDDTGKDFTAMCVARNKDGKFNVLNMIIGKNAIRLYEMLTNQNKMNRWKYRTHYGERYRVCPVCNTEKKDDKATGWNFCQYCGADLRGDINADDN